MFINVHLKHPTRSEDLKHLKTKSETTCNDLCKTMLFQVDLCFMFFYLLLEASDFEYAARRNGCQARLARLPCWVDKGNGLEPPSGSPDVGRRFFISSSLGKSVGSWRCEVFPKTIIAYSLFQKGMETKYMKAPLSIFILHLNHRQNRTSLACEANARTLHPARNGFLAGTSGLLGNPGVVIVHLSSSCGVKTFWLNERNCILT